MNKISTGTKNTLAFGWPRKLATAALFSLAAGASLIAASPALAANNGTMSKSEMKHSDPETVEARIKYLHDKFAITPAQETLWSSVAQVMTDNAAKLNSLVKTRSENAANATAIDDLKSYEAIAEAHEDGTKNLIPAFQALYDSMSDAQKKTADAEFRGHGHHA